MTDADIETVVGNENVQTRSMVNIDLQDEY